MGPAVRAAADVRVAPSAPLCPMICGRAAAGGVSRPDRPARTRRAPCHKPDLPASGGRSRAAARSAVRSGHDGQIACEGAGMVPPDRRGQIGVAAIRPGMTGIGGSSPVVTGVMASTGTIYHDRKPGSVAQPNKPGASDFDKGSLHESLFNEKKLYLKNKNGLFWKILFYI